VRLTAIVPATDRPATLGRCLDAIEASALPPDELIVVEEPVSAGPAAARNLGVEQATGDVLVFVDADVVVHADAFERIRRAFASDPGLVAVFGSYDDRPEAPGVVSSFRNLLHHHVHQEGAGRASTFWAGLGAVRQEAFRSVGGFDAARYPRASIEDVEFGLRLAATGAELELDPGLQGTHLKAWTLRSMVETDFSRRGVPWVELLVERRQATRALNLGARHRASALASLVLATGLVARRPLVVGAGLGVLLALNRSFYRVLLERAGAGTAVAGVGLHAIHHLTAIAAVPAGLVRASQRCLRVQT
jgi:glycosyltransferase involved in cell wall biosynthesis